MRQKHFVRCTAIFALAVAVNLRCPGMDFTPVATPVIPSHSVTLLDFGGVGDGLTLNTKAFADALAALAQKGGGRLVVPPGLWLTGPIRLCSNLELRVERGALIKFSADYQLYPLTVTDTKGEKEVNATSPISGQDLENVAITGGGILDGGGDAWRPLYKDKVTEGEWRALTNSSGVVNARGNAWWPSAAALAGEKTVEALRTKGSLKLEDYEPAHQYLRPKMLRLIGCKRVLLADVTFQNPPNWTLNPLLCEDVSILNVQVRNSPAAQNSDALDLESCRHALIAGCTFDVGDDGICIKSGKDAAGRRIGVPTEDVLVKDCVVYHAHGGLTIGSEMSGGVRHLLVTNCVFMGTDIGLRFKSTRGRGGVAEDIHITDVRMTDIPGDAINFNLYYGGKSPLDDTQGKMETNIPTVDEGTPQFRDIHIHNVICRGAKRAIVLEGLPEMPIRDLALNNVDITSQQGVFVTDADHITFDHVHVACRTGDAVKTVRVKNSQLQLAP